MKHAFLASLLALACSSPVDFSTSSAPIVNGTTDTTDTSVVGVVAFASPGDDGNVVQCTGTVVSPHVVLTAAHCLDPAIAGPIDHVNIFLGSDLSDPTQQADPTLLVDVASATFNPSFDPDAMTGDIGIVVTSQALTLTPETLSHSSIDSGLVGTQVTSVGFGLSNAADSNSSGPRRSATTSVVAVDDEHISLDDVICEGDSGGPTFLSKNGARTIIGVHSFTFADNCVGAGDDTRVDVYVSSVIDPAIQQADPGFLPASGCNASGSSASPWPFAAALLAFARRARKSQIM